MAQWNCEHSMKKVWTCIVNFWKTEEGKQYSYRLDKNSCLKVVDGIESMTGIKISLFYVQGLINGHLHTPEGAILHYIYTVSRKSTPTETFCKHAKLYFNLRLSIEEVEEILIKLNSQKVGKTTVLVTKENDKNYPIDDKYISNIDLEKKYKKALIDFSIGVSDKYPSSFSDLKKKYNN